MKKLLQTIFTGLLLLLAAYFCLIGVKGFLDGRQQTTDDRADFGQLVTDGGILLPDGFPAVCRLPTTDFPAVCELPSAVFINGPVVSDVGELCVFRLSDPTIRADWTVVRQTDQELRAVFYIDTSGSALTFSSSLPAKYTIIAAIVEEGVPKILQHVCQYGLAPTPSPGPNPQPDPTPLPSNLAEWVRQNIPDAGRGNCAVLASIYTATTEAIDKGTIRSQAAAFSSIRANTQAKIKPGTWEKFFDELAIQIESKLDGSTEIKPLGLLFQEVADGLKLKVENEIPEDSGLVDCPPCPALSPSFPARPASRVPDNSRFQPFRFL